MGEVERVGGRLKYTLDTVNLLYGIKAATLEEECMGVITHPCGYPKVIIPQLS